MRVLMVHNRYRSGAPGGEDAVFDAESRLLEAAGHEVIRYVRSNDEMHEGNFIDGVRVSAGLFASKETRRDIDRLIEAHRPEVAHFHNLFPLIGLNAYRACDAAGVPIVQTIHNYRYSCAAGTHYRDGTVCESCREGDSLSAVRHRCFRGSLPGSLVVASMVRRYRVDVFQHRRRSHFIVLSGFAARRLEAFGVDHERITVRPNFADDLPALHEGERSYAVYSGRLSPEKGVWSLLEAWRDIPNLPLKIIGDGPLRDALQRRADELSIDVEFLGMCGRSEALQIVRAARLQVVPSEWFEGMPLVVLEAWGLEVPVVMSRIGSLIEMAGNEERALLFTPGDPAELAAQVRRLCDSSELRQGLSCAAKEVFLKRHTAQRALETLLDTYRRTIAEQVA